MFARSPAKALSMLHNAIKYSHGVYRHSHSYHDDHHDDHHDAHHFAIFTNVHEPSDYTDAQNHGADIGASLAVIHDEHELSRARDAIEHAGVEKAITAAECTSSGWTWGGTDAWKSSEFPLNTGKVADHADCTDGDYMYSLHASSSWVSIWDADMKDEKHPVLCRFDGEGTRVRNQC